MPSLWCFPQFRLTLNSTLEVSWSSWSPLVTCSFLQWPYIWEMPKETQSCFSPRCTHTSFIGFSELWSVITKNPYKNNFTFGFQLCAERGSLRNVFIKKKWKRSLYGSLHLFKNIFLKKALSWLTIHSLLWLSLIMMYNKNRAHPSLQISAGEVSYDWEIGGTCERLVGEAIVKKSCQAISSNFFFFLKTSFFQSSLKF